MHELAKDPFEVGVGVMAVAADLLDEGVSDGTAPTGVLSADKHPIFHAELGGTNGSFGVVVVEFESAVFKARFKMRPLVAGVLECFSQVAFGQDSSSSLEMIEEFGEMPVDAPEKKSARSLS